VAQHDQPIKCVKWIDAPQPVGGILATGSWDRTVKVNILNLSSVPIS
jgi:mRNA export factor